MSGEKHVNYFAIIPATVRYDKNLSPTLKLLYAELTALSNKYGYCFATNSYLADLFTCSIRSIQNYLLLLKKYKYIDVILIYAENSNEVIGRRIYIQELSETTKKNIEKEIKSDGGLVKNSSPGLMKDSSPGGEEIFTYNNIILKDLDLDLDLNKKSMSSSELDVSISKSSKTVKPEIQEVFDYWKIKMSKKRAVLNKTRIGKINARLNEGFSVEELKQAVDGAAKSDFYMGRGDFEVVYNDITTIFRDDGQITRLIELSKKKSHAAKDRVIVDHSGCRLCEVESEIGKACPIHGGKNEKSAP